MELNEYTFPLVIFILLMILFLALFGREKIRNSIIKEELFQLKGEKKDREHLMPVISGSMMENLGVEDIRLSYHHRDSYPEPRDVAITIDGVVVHSILPANESLFELVREIMS